MEFQNLRYKGSGLKKYAFTDEFSVVCPKCSNEAIVLSEGDCFGINGKVHCSSCTFRQSSEELVRFRLKVDGKCTDCWEEIHLVVEDMAKPLLNLEVECTSCRTKSTHSAKSESYKKFSNSEHLVSNDPIFNLPLWLQTDIKGNRFFAYNRRHLAEIETYVGTKLRERQVKGLTSMVERLPKFITKSKNRLPVIEAIRNLSRR